MTFGEESILVSCIIGVMLILLMRPVWLNRYKKADLQSLPIGSLTKEEAKIHITRKLQQFRRAYTYLRIMFSLYAISSAFLLFVFLSKDIHGFWIFFTIISGSIAISLLILFQLGIRIQEITLKRLT